MTPPPLDSPPTALDDAGTTQAMLFLGWLPPAVTAVVGGIVVAVLTGDPSAFVIVALAGTVVGYIVGLTLTFTVGHRLAQRRASASTANRFVKIAFWSGVPVAIAIAVLALIEPSLAILATVVALGFVVLAVAYLAITNESSPGETDGDDVSPRR